jgi:signal transduction histidine kinase
VKIRLKLTLLFTALFAGLLLVFALTIYFTQAAQREQEYFKRLRQLAVTKANLLFQARVQEGVLQLIYQNSLGTLPQEEVAIYDTAYHLLYHDAMDIDKVRETTGMLDSILMRKELHFNYEDLQVNGFVYSVKGKTYVITAAARDDDGLGRLRSLGIQLVLGFAIAIGLTLVAGILFVRKALEPMEQSFEAQKRFVSNISHELRTPLAAIIAEVELSAMKERTPEEYREALRLVLQDARRVTRLSADLLDLAKASYDPSGISFQRVRLDEVVMEARQPVIQANPNYLIDIAFTKEIEEGDPIMITGNEYLLKVAFSNLMENACKFSADHRCEVSIGFIGGRTTLWFRDHGIGIPAADLPNIYTPFYRGENRRYAPGNGIGLSLTKRIIELHQGVVRVDSHAGEGTVFTLSIPSISG